MKKECKVSVIVPMHNAAEHVSNCLNSILSQTLKEIEVICVNDGSTDNTAQIVQSFIDKDERVSIINQENLYAGVARNAGIKKSSGTYLVFWDADDMFEENALAEMYQQSEADQADICVCDAVQFKTGEEDILLTNVRYLKDRFLPDKTPFSIKDIPEYIFNFTTSVPWNKMYRKSFVEKNNLEFEDRIRANDQYFVLQAFALAERITLVRKHLIRYRISQASNLTASLSDTPLCIYEALLHTKEVLEQRGIFADEKVRQSFANRVASSVFVGMERQTTSVGFMKIYQTLKDGGLAKLFITDQDESYFYNKSGYRRSKQIREGEAIEYLLNEYSVIANTNANLRYQKNELKNQKKKAEKDKRSLERELAYIQERKWYRAITGLAGIKNTVFGKR